MSWFDSLLDGLGSVVNWTMAHSGEIGSVVNAVGTVASLLAAAEETVDDTDPTDLFPSFKKAGDYLETVAASEVPSAPISAGTNTRKYSIQGIWKSAAPLDASQNPSPEMYHDVANILAQNNIPEAFVGAKGYQTDVSKDIAQAIFADNPSPPPPPTSDSRLSKSNKRPSYIAAPKFKFSNNDASCVISGAHAYYAIPMGKAATENIWHGALQIEVTSTPDFDQRYIRKKRNFRYQTQQLATADNVWLVTCQMTWNSVSLAQEVFPLLKTKLSSEYPNYNVVFDNLSGLIQTMKIQAPSDTTPAQVRCGLTQAVLDTLTQLQNAQEEQKDSTPNIQLPLVMVTDSTLIVGGT